MSLKDFHIVFITASVLLSLAFATWGFVQYRQLHASLYAGVSFLSFITAIGLASYEVLFIRKTKATDDH